MPGGVTTIKLLQKFQGISFLFLLQNTNVTQNIINKSKGTSLWLIDYVVTASTSHMRSTYHLWIESLNRNLYEEKKEKAFLLILINRCLLITTIDFK